MVLNFMAVLLYFSRTGGVMPVVAANLDQNLYTAVEEALSRGNYSDLQQFLVVALRNQLALEASVGAPLAAASAPDVPNSSAPAAAQGLSARLAAIPIAVAAELPEPPHLNDESVVLWGQVNRLLPIAAGIRVLAHLSAEHGEEVSVAEWHEVATDAAVALRSHLRRLDEEAGRRHGSLWATAFPEATEASAHRYANQFLGFPKNGVPDGGAAFLGFVTFDGHDDVRLTSAGAEWASLPNPIFDGGDWVPTRTFSVEETEFFINHLKDYRRAELAFLQRVAALVAQGRTRTQLDEALAREYPEWQKYIETMRAGALGRMSDLGLLGRTRRGLTVDYALTPLAREVGLLSDEEADAA